MAQLAEATAASSTTRTMPAAATAHMQPGSPAGRDLESHGGAAGAKRASEPNGFRKLFGCARLHSALCVAFFAWVGMALRLALAALVGTADMGLTTSVAAGPSTRCDTQSTASGYFFQNVLGCFLMAVIGRHKTALNEHIATGLSAGLCGSLTTWGTWATEEAVTVLNGEILKATVSEICMLSVCMSSFKLGHYTARAGMQGVPPDASGASGGSAMAGGLPTAGLPPVASDGLPERLAPAGSAVVSREGSGGIEEREEWALELDTPKSWSEDHGPQLHIGRRRHGLIMVAAVGIILSTFAVLARARDVKGLLCMAMAPFGALLRWALSLGNPSTAPYPVFTLIANTLGCGVNALAGVMAGRAPAGLERAAWGALSSGFCGSLTTVSTLIAELRGDKLGGLRQRSAYFMSTLCLAMAVVFPVYAFAGC